MDRYGNRNAARWFATAARQLNPSLLSVKKDKAVSSGLLTTLVSAVSLKNAPMQVDLTDDGSKG